MPPTVHTSTQAVARRMMLLSLALASLVPVSSTEARVAPHGGGSRGEPCNVELAGAGTEDWQLVKGEGFTFCVPSDWKVSKSRARFSGGSIEWSVGQPIRSKVAFVVGSRSGGAPGDGPLRPPGAIVLEERTAGGDVLEIWHARQRGDRLSGAHLTERNVHFAGEARTDEQQAIQLNVYRTVRLP